MSENERHSRHVIPEGTFISENTGITSA